MPQVSIIMPVYNTAMYIDESVQSIVAQTFTDWELLLVDDGSTDGSGEKCRTWALQDTRILLIQQPNAGHGAARNTGLAKAQGQWILFVDSDDYILEQTLEVLVKCAQVNQYDFVRYRFARFKDGASNHLAIEWEPMGSMCNNTEVFAGLLAPLLGSLDKKAPICGTVCTTLYRSSLIREWKLSFQQAREVQSEDLLFNIAFLTHASSGILISDVFYMYRMRNTSFTNQYSPEVFLRLLRLQAILVKWALPLEDREELYQRMDARLLDAVSVCAKNAALLPSYTQYKKNIQEMVDAPAVQRALQGPAGKTRAFPLNLFCFLLSHKKYRVFRFLVKLYQAMPESKRYRTEVRRAHGST